MRGHTSTRSKPRARRAYPRETISRRAIEGDGLLALRRLLESPRLISRAVEYVRDLCPAARPAVVDEVFAGWKTLHPCGGLLLRPAGIRVFAHWPEPVGDAVDEPVRGVRTCPLNPVEKDLVEVEIRVPGDTIPRHWPETSRARRVRPLAFTPSANFFSPSRPSYSRYSPASIESMLDRTRRRMSSSCCAVNRCIRDVE